MSLDSQLDLLISSVQASSKYRTLSPDVVRTIGAQELKKRRQLKEAIKATKNKLHQIAGAYQTGKIEYAGWLQALQQTGDDPGALQTVCREIMAHHASTRERLVILDEFYHTLFAGLPPITSILDLACGLNPLAIPWMPLPAGVTYAACDIYQDQVDFLQQCFVVFGVEGAAQPCDLLQACPTQAADVVLLLKTIPCLEQVDKTIGRKLLDTLNAPILCVSFPAQSLGGRHKGMTVNYEQHFRELVADKPWQIERFDFATELVFRVLK
ncbi:MAG: 16S rRNA methyltransferase [Chloroflexi bacterium]|nr:16S rRNA methyltransferase [Chloroflexota bacterium]